MIVLVLILVVVVFAPSLWVRWVMNAHSEDLEGMPGTGGELAQHLIERFGLDSVKVETTEIGDHYDPVDKRVRLSEANFSGRSLTAVAIAAHEVGHAM
ncbi:zinc metallopeptidase, partial [Pseudomonadales bacterium]|nr:zinc metallopeptidase [Pseudomonadales bacterium]